MQNNACQVQTHEQTAIIKYSDDIIYMPEVQVGFFKNHSSTITCLIPIDWKT